MEKLTVDETLFLPHFEGQIIRFKSTQGNTQTWKVVSKFQRIKEIPQRPAIFSKPKPIFYCVFNVVLEEENTKEQIKLGYNIPPYEREVMGLFGEYHNNDKNEMLFGVSEGLQNRNTVNVSISKDIEFQQQLNDEKPKWFKIKKGEGLISYEIDSIQVYEKY